MAGILSALLVGGPVAGIMEIEESHSLLASFIAATKKCMDLIIEDYQTCDDVLQYLVTNHINDLKSALLENPQFQEYLY